jgi:DNA-binding transcriptional ArsR family regulator
MEATVPQKSARAPSRSPAKQEGECRVLYVDEAKVARALLAIPSPPTVEEIAAVFDVLSDPTRVRILIALCNEELCVCDLAKVAERSMAATSHQLRLLRQMKLVKYRMDGKLAYYTLTSAWIRRLLKDALNRLDAEESR